MQGAQFHNKIEPGRVRIAYLFRGMDNDWYAVRTLRPRLRLTWDSQVGRAQDVPDMHSPTS